MKNYWAKIQQMAEETCHLTSPPRPRRSRASGNSRREAENRHSANGTKAGVQGCHRTKLSHLGLGPQGQSKLEAGRADSAGNSPALLSPSLKVGDSDPRLRVSPPLPTPAEGNVNPLGG